MKFFALLLFVVALPLTACAGSPLLLRDPQDSSFHVKITKYEVENSKRDFLAVIFPPTGGSTSLDRGHAKSLQRAGVNVWVIEEWTGYDEFSLDPELHDRHITRAKRAFAFIKKERPGKFRLLGTSLGGMYVAALAAEHPEIENWVAIASGAPFSRVLAQSEQEQSVKIRQARKSEWGFTNKEEYESILGEAISQDILPPRFSGKRVPGIEGPKSRGSNWNQKDVLLVIATEDDSVPTDSQFDLWQAVGKPRKIEIANSHVWAIIKAYWSYGDEIANHLLR
jgi:pimeloyl-ACP methyl ester carboxylesterase